jgi:hypothetical protein
MLQHCSKRQAGLLYEVVEGTAGTEHAEDWQEELAGEYEVVEEMVDVEHTEERWEELDGGSMRSLRERQAQSTQKRGGKSWKVGV